MNPKSECCEWKGTLSKSGYGVVTIDGKQFKVHRLAVILSGRKYKKGMVTDHLCRNRKCYNPDHLEVVTSGENVLRGVSFSAKNKVKIACPKGHLYSEFGGARKRKTGKTWRWCRKCLNTSKNAKRKLIPGYGQ